MSPSRPGADEYAPFYAGYVARVTEDDILGVLAAQKDEIGSARALRCRRRSSPTATPRASGRSARC